MHQRVVVHLQRAAPAKPAPGEVCNGCGVCCALETCPAGRLRFLQAQGPCPALRWQVLEQRYQCGLLAEPDSFFPGLPQWAIPWMKRRLHRWIAAGQGCDCRSEIETA